MKELWMLTEMLVMIVMIFRRVDNVVVAENNIKVIIEENVPEKMVFRKIRIEIEIYGDEFNSSVNSTEQDCGTIPTSGSGVYNISLDGYRKQIYCEVNSTTGVKYLVFQRRLDGSVDFRRNWTEYENGFGNLNGEFWMGNKALHMLTSKKKYKLLIELQANDSTQVYAHYDTFSVGSPQREYKLNVNGYSGNAGDSLSIHSGQMFTTFDNDNDGNPSNCAAKFKGAWWYKNCHESNLNGYYYGGRHSSYGDGADWRSFRGYNESMKRISMKMYY